MNWKRYKFTLILTFVLSLAIACAGRPTQKSPSPSKESPLADPTGSEPTYAATPGQHLICEYTANYTGDALKDCLTEIYPVFRCKKKSFGSDVTTTCPRNCYGWGGVDNVVRLCCYGLYSPCANHGYCFKCKGKWTQNWEQDCKSACVEGGYKIEEVYKGSCLQAIVNEGWKCYTYYCTNSSSSVSDPLDCKNGDASGLVVIVSISAAQPYLCEDPPPYCYRFYCTENLQDPSVGWVDNPEDCNKQCQPGILAVQKVNNPGCPHYQPPVIGQWEGFDPGIIGMTARLPELPKLSQWPPKGCGHFHFCGSMGGYVRNPWECSDAKLERRKPTVLKWDDWVIVQGEPWDAEYLCNIECRSVVPCVEAGKWNDRHVYWAEKCAPSDYPISAKPHVLCRNKKMW